MFIKADKLGYSWEADANSTWENSSNWKRMYIPIMWDMENTIVTGEFGNFAMAPYKVVSNANTPLYLTGNSTTVQKSIDGGTTWSPFISGGNNFISGAAEAISGTVFVIDTGAGTVTTRPIYAYTSNGTLLDSTTFDRTSSFSQVPLTFQQGRLFVTDNQPAGIAGQGTAYSNFNGSSFINKPTASIGAINWSAYDSTNFIYQGVVNLLLGNGTSGSTAIERDQNIGKPIDLFVTPIENTTPSNEGV